VFYFSHSLSLALIFTSFDPYSSVCVFSLSLVHTEHASALRADLPLFTHMLSHRFSRAFGFMHAGSAFTLSLTSLWRRGGVLLPMAVTPPYDELIL
jgi:hypothetical protein